MLTEIFHDSLKILKFARICMENHSSVLGGKSYFSNTNPSEFQRPLQSLLLRYNAEKIEVTYYFVDIMNKIN